MHAAAEPLPRGECLIASTKLLAISMPNTPGHLCRAERQGPSWTVSKMARQLLRRLSNPALCVGNTAQRSNRCFDRRKPVPDAVDELFIASEGTCDRGALFGRTTRISYFVGMVDCPDMVPSRRG